MYPAFFNTSIEPLAVPPVANTSSKTRTLPSPSWTSTTDSPYSNVWATVCVLPGKTHTVAHTLEYGESIVEVQEGEGKVLVFDDVLATGGTAKGSIEVLKKAGYTPTSALFLVELDFLNAKLDVPHESIIHYE